MVCGRCRFATLGPSREVASGMWLLISRGAIVKKLVLLSTASLALMAGAATAADLPSRRPAPAPYAAVPVFTWTGIYFGVNAGYAFNDQSGITTRGNNGLPTGPGTLFNTNANIRRNAVNLETDGFSGGGQIGYNYQFGNIVLGIEADAAYTDMRRTSTVFGATPAAAGFAASTYRTELSYLGTVRGRLGYAFDRMMVYGTGGFAYGDVENTQLFFAPGTGTNVLQFSGRRSQMETGYVVGGGVEYAIPTETFSLFSNAVTIKAEALYYDLGKQTLLVNGVVPAPIAGSGVTTGTSYTSRSETNGVIARAGLNFKFNGF